MLTVDFWKTYMRLLDTKTGRFVIVKDPREVHYAILSHVWLASGEQSYQQTLAFQSLEGADVLQLCSPKVQKACSIARKHGFGLIWIDSTCIDQANNTELSEAINSMYQWYKRARVCYAYLETVEDAPLTDHEKATSRFRDSRWFTRGWTLQELIAPHELLFYGKEWQLIGTKQNLVHVISQITNIDCAVLLDDAKLKDVSIAQRMSWAARRETTKDEDRAYCLMGIFDVNMTPKYGEGLERAFVRLQKAILKRHPDQSLLAWGRCVPLTEVRARAALSYPDRAHPRANSDPYLFSPGPRAFGHFSRTTSLSQMELAGLLKKNVRTSHEYVTSAEGTRTTFPVIRIPVENDETLLLALLCCKDESGNLIALALRPSPVELHSEAMFVGAYLPAPHSSASTYPPGAGYNGRGQPPSGYFRLVSLPLSNIDDWGAIEADSIVYINDYPRAQQMLPQDLDIHRITTAYPGSHPFYASLTFWCGSVLRMTHYKVAEPETTAQALDFAWILRSSREPDVIKVHFGYCKCLDGDNHGFLRVRVIHSRSRPLKDTSCKYLEHLRDWPYHVGSGTVSQTFKLPAKSDKHRALRVSVGLGEDHSKKSARSYILDFQILSFPPEDAALLPTAWCQDIYAEDQVTQGQTWFGSNQLTSSPTNTPFAGRSRILEDGESDDERSVQESAADVLDYPHAHQHRDTAGRRATDRRNVTEMILRAPLPRKKTAHYDEQPAEVMTASGSAPHRKTTAQAAPAAFWGASELRQASSNPASPRGSPRRTLSPGLILDAEERAGSAGRRPSHGSERAKGKRSLPKAIDGMGRFQNFPRPDWRDGDLRATHTQEHGTPRSASRDRIGRDYVDCELDSDTSVFDTDTDGKNEPEDGAGYADGEENKFADGMAQAVADRLASSAKEPMGRTATSRSGFGLSKSSPVSRRATVPTQKKVRKSARHNGVASHDETHFTTTDNDTPPAHVTGNGHISHKDVAAEKLSQGSIEGGVTHKKGFWRRLWKWSREKI